MKYGWRGVVDASGDVVAWPMLLADHRQAFATIPGLGENYRARWRQWGFADDPIDFDAGVSPEDRAKVEAWVKAASA